MNNELVKELKDSIISINKDITSDYPFFYKMDLSFIQNEFFVILLMFSTITIFSFLILFVLFEAMGINKMSSSMIEAHMTDEMKERVKKQEKENEINKEKNKVGGIIILVLLSSILLFFGFLIVIIMNSSNDYKEYTSKKIKESNFTLETLVIDYEIFDFESNKDTQKVYFTKDKEIYGEVYYNGDIKKGKQNTISIIDGDSLKNLIREIESEGYILDGEFKKYLLEQKDKIQSVELTNINFKK